jgi:putative hydrolase of the HAD superfamily
MKREIKNIIFDFGGVIIDIDYNRAINVFQEKGLSDFKTHFTGDEQAAIFDDLDKGKIETSDFINYIKVLFGNRLNENEIEDIWNLILIGIPPYRIKLLRELKDNYRIFLLSNTNEIHYRKYNNDLMREFGVPDISLLFEKAYFSFKLGMRKPGIEIFEFVLADADLIPEETLFIDDSEANLQSPSIMGINTYHLKRGDDITDVFDNGRLKVNWFSL